MHLAQYNHIVEFHRFATIKAEKQEYSRQSTKITINIVYINKIF